MKKIEENLNELLEVFDGTGVPNNNWVKDKLEETLIVAKNCNIANVSERFSPIDKNDPTFEILFRDGNWGAYNSQLTDMLREMVIRYNKLVEYLNAH